MSTPVLDLLQGRECAGENGEKGWRMADWRDIEAYYRKTGSLGEFFQNVEFTAVPST
ncbi:MAG: hypothetical protein LBU11_02435 [Zoogloeaceae bacterium]|nr:hypothetical protein [Zoogloeaceae bacterium]